MTQADKKVIKIARADDEALVDLCYHLTKQWGRQATRADAVHYLVLLADDRTEAWIKGE